MACLIVLCHRVLVGCEPDPECFRPAKGVLLRQFVKAALDAGKAVGLSAKEAVAAYAVTWFVAEVTTADWL